MNISKIKLFGLLGLSAVFTSGMNAGKVSDMILDNALVQKVVKAQVKKQAKDKYKFVVGKLDKTQKDALAEVSELVNSLRDNFGKLNSQALELLSGSKKATISLKDAIEKAVEEQLAASKNSFSNMQEPVEKVVKEVLEFTKTTKGKALLAAGVGVGSIVIATVIYNQLKDKSDEDSKKATA